jgi:hypothetical protein
VEVGTWGVIEQGVFSIVFETTPILCSACRSLINLPSLFPNSDVNEVTNLQS